MKTNRISGYWCLEYDCWPEDHPGCTKREETGCDQCQKSIFQISEEKSDGEKLTSEEIIQ